MTHKQWFDEKYPDAAVLGDDYPLLWEVTAAAWSRANSEGFKQGYDAGYRDGKEFKIAVNELYEQGFADGKRASMKIIDRTFDEYLAK